MDIVDLTPTFLDTKDGLYFNDPPLQRHQANGVMIIFFYDSQGISNLLSLH